MHIDEDKVNPVSFAHFLGEAGYTVGYFGTRPQAPQAVFPASPAVPSIPRACIGTPSCVL